MSGESPPSIVSGSTVPPQTSTEEVKIFSSADELRSFLRENSVEGDPYVTYNRGIYNVISDTYLTNISSLHPSLSLVGGEVTSVGIGDDGSITRVKGVGLTNIESLTGLADIDLLPEIISVRYADDRQEMSVQYGYNGSPKAITISAEGVVVHVDGASDFSPIPLADFLSQ